MIFRPPAKDGRQNVRDNNAAWVAGPSRICFSSQLELFGAAGLSLRLFTRK